MFAHWETSHSVSSYQDTWTSPGDSPSPPIMSGEF